MSPIPTDTYSIAAPQPKQSLLGIGGPLFNAMLIMTLMAISFAAVALPERSEDLATAAPSVLTPPTTVQTALPETTTSTTTEPVDRMAALLGAVSTSDLLLDTFPAETVPGPSAATESSTTAPAPSTPQPQLTQVGFAPTLPVEEVERVVFRTERVVVEVPASTIPRRPECGDFDTRPDAQAAFDADPDSLAHFDGDGDGFACEQLVDPNPAPALILCDDFDEWAAAQATFISDPEAFSHLDGDGDGRPCEQLPGAPAELPAPPPDAAVLSVNEVRQQAGVFGLHTREAPWWFGEVDYVSRLIGKAPNNLLFFSNWSDPFPAEQVGAAWDRSMTPQIAWEPVIPGADQQPRLREIADGEWDGYIDTWASAAAAHGEPIVLRLAAEMNGDWYPWSAGVNGNEAADFGDMWRHVHQRFDAAGADNVVWLWSVNRSDNLRSDIADYWPGDEYVDWVGIAGYWRGFGSAPEPTFTAIYDQTLGELRALTSKPILLAEVGAGTDVDADRITWLSTLFAGLDANPDIIGFVYFNDIKSGGDWRIQFSQTVVDTFADGVASDRFPSGVLPAGMEPGSRLNVPAHNDPNNLDLAPDEVPEATERLEDVPAG